MFVLLTGRKSRSPIYKQQNDIFIYLLFLILQAKKLFTCVTTQLVDQSRKVGGELYTNTREIKMSPRILPGLSVQYLPAANIFFVFCFFVFLFFVFCLKLYIVVV